MGSDGTLDSVEEFARLAREYVRLIDDRAKSGEELMTKLELCLAKLYATAIRLPERASDHSQDAMVTPSLHADAMEKLKGRLMLSGYWVAAGISEDGTEAPAPTLSMFADDLSDVYADLRIGLDIAAAFDRISRGVPDDSVWHWRFGFQRHWGRHALDALSAIHQWRHGG